MRHQRTNLIHIQPKPVFSIPIKINQVTYIITDDPDFINNIIKRRR